MSVCHAASIGLHEESLEFSGPQGAHWRVPLASIRVLGEFRDVNEEHGHFLAVVIDDSGAWLQAPCNAIGMDQLLAELSKRWRTQLKLELAHTSSAQSRVIWPPQRVGAELFANDKAHREIEATLVNK